LEIKLNKSMQKVPISMIEGLEFAGSIVSWAYIDCSQKLGTYIRNAGSSIMNVTIPDGHGFINGSSVSIYVNITSGSPGSNIDQKIFNASVISSTQITFDSGVTGAATGNLSINSPILRGSNNVSNVVLDRDNVPGDGDGSGAEIRFTLNFTNSLIDSNYAVIANAYYYPGGGIVGAEAQKYGAFVQVDNRPSEKITTSFKFVVVDPTNNTYATEWAGGNWPFIHLMVVR
jgi:hypothetical protein